MFPKQQNIKLYLHKGKNNDNFWKIKQKKTEKYTNIYT